MPKARLRIHDQSRANHQETINALKQALNRGQSHDADGVIIIMTDRRGKEATILRAGKLSKHDRALMQVARLKLHLIVDNDETEPG